MLATLRKKLKGVSIRNRSLQDILLTCGRAKRVISVESHPAGIHNTKLIVELPDGRHLVHFYSRLNLATLSIQHLVTTYHNGVFHYYLPFQAGLPKVQLYLLLISTLCGALALVVRTWYKL